jgi:hypothetical protein
MCPLSMRVESPVAYEAPASPVSIRELKKVIFG